MNTECSAFELCPSYI